MRLGGAAAAAGVVLLASCGVVDGLSGTGTPAEPRTAKVAVLVPASGALGADGDAVVAAVESALADVHTPGWVIEVDRVDDGGGTAGARAAAAEIASDRDVIAVVGGLSAESVRAAQPALDGARIPFISPADAAIEHTRGADPTAPQRPYSTYFRTATPGGDLVDAALDFAVNGLGVTTIGVVAEGDVDEVARLARGARQRSVDVVAAERGDIAGAVSTLREADGTALYVSGDDRFAAAVASAVVSAGLDATVLAGPSARTDEFLVAAGAAAVRTVVFEPGDVEPADGVAVPGLPDPGQFGAAAYDAATAIATAAERCLPPVRDEPARGARRGCLSELAAVSFDGVTGPVAFDSFGERQGSVPRAYVVVGGAWTELGTL